MVNSSASSNANATKDSLFYGKFVFIAGTTEMILVILILLCFCIFLYIITLILKVYSTTPHVQENARYVLFAHMLINDTLYLIVSLSLFLSGMYRVFMPMSLCYVMLTLGTSTFRVTAYNLATMALERYVAICYPLRHFQICNAHQANNAIIVMWVVGVMPNVADFFALQSTVHWVFFSLNVKCDLAMLTVNPLQSNIRTVTFIASFILVAMLIIFTYIKVIGVARKIGSGTSSASKAGKTVMLHALQLLLCMSAFISTILDSHLASNLPVVSMANFLVFTCLPRFISPVIYGVRDEAFHKYIRTLFLLPSLNIICRHSK